MLLNRRGYFKIIQRQISRECWLLSVTEITLAWRFGNCYVFGRSAVAAVKKRTCRDELPDEIPGLEKGP